MLAQKARKLRQGAGRIGEGRDDNHLAKFQGHRSGFVAEVGEIVFVAFAYFFDEAMHAQTFEQTSDLAGGFMGEILRTQLLVGEPADQEFALEQGAKQAGVLFREEIKALVAMLVFDQGLSQFVQFLHADTRRGNGSDELEVTLIGSGEHFPQSGQRVNGLFHRGPTSRRRTIAMLNLAIVLKEGDVVDGRFDAQDEAEFIVHFDGDGPHLMFDACAQPALVQAITDLSPVVATPFASEEGGNICGFHHMSQGFQEMRVERLQSFSALEHQVRRILGLQNAPVIVQLQVGDDRTILPGQLIQPSLQVLAIELICQLVGHTVICNMDEGIIYAFIGDPPFLQLTGQPVVSVEIELQPEGTPGRDPQIAQAHLLIHQVEVVGHTFAAVRLQICLPAHFVMPRTIRGTGFHRTQDMDQPRLRASFLQDLLHPVFLANVLAANKLNFHPVRLCQRFGIRTHALSQRFCKFGVIKDADPVLIQIARHAVRIPQRQQRACDDDPIITTQDPFRFLGPVLYWLFLVDGII